MTTFILNKVYLGSYFAFCSIPWISVSFMRLASLSSGFFIIYDSTILNPIHTAALPGDSFVKKDVNGASPVNFLMVN